jgi:sugar O-acyltransferase (sialic acid O-acetyltransferase NeuD family)
MQAEASKPLIIVGFSGFGKEIHWLAERRGLSIAGFLDDDPQTKGCTFRGAAVLGTSAEWNRFGDVCFVIAIGNPRTRKNVYRQMMSHGEPEFATLIDPAAILESGQVTIGNGSIICAGTVVTTDVAIGNHCIINLNCTVGHDVVMRDFCTVAPLAAISGNCHFEELVEVGTGACIRQGLRLERGSVLGMGGVLTKDAPENTVLVGNPAKKLRSIEE